MKRILTIFLMILSVIGLSGCQRQEPDPDQIFQMYYVSNKETRVEIHEYVMQATDPASQLSEMMEQLAVMPAKLEYKAPLAMGFSVLGYSLTDTTLTVNVDRSYLELAPTTEVLVRAALVCSLTQIEGIEYVMITVEDNPLYDNLENVVGAMSSDMFINNMGSEINSYDTVELTLYFTNEAGDGLIAVKREKTYNTNISLDRLVVEELLLGPQNVDGVYPTINPGTKAISVITKDGVCYVSLDEMFLNQVYNVTADVTWYSLVNSLVELSNVNKVQISINGDTSGTYREKYSFSGVYERNLDLVTTLD